MNPEELGLEVPRDWGVFSMSKPKNRSTSTPVNAGQAIVSLSESDDLSVKAAFEEFDRFYEKSNQQSK